MGRSKSKPDDPADAWLGRFPKTLAYAETVARSNLRGQPDVAAGVRTAVRTTSRMFYGQESVDPGITQAVEDGLTLGETWTETVLVDGERVDRIVINGFFLDRERGEYAFLLNAANTDERPLKSPKPTTWKAIAKEKPAVFPSAADEVEAAEHARLVAERTRLIVDGVRSAIENLAGPDQVVAKLELARLLSGESRAEMARSLGVPTSTLHDRAQRVLKLLRLDSILQALRELDSI